MEIDIRIAQIAQLEAVAELFDRYRVFYGQNSDLAAAQGFIQERLASGDSTILMAMRDGVAMGFVQLYPSYSSVSMQRIWILNDLFVDMAYRRQGIAGQLMQAAAKYGRETRALRLTLATQVTNTAAQKLYESLGYQRNQDFHYYALAL